jgi:glutamyl/glutaminyl-tRNA synthetase
MRSGELPDGSHVLRAKADMQHENMQLRDPIMYRIRHEHHHRTGDQWVLYPTYDWAHGQSDAIEGVTHSLCSLEFDSHRALYDWYLEHCPLPGDQPRQTEFARLELTYTVTSKRKLRQLIEDGIVEGWDDPRLPTLRALRRRGYPGLGHPRLLRLHRRREDQQPPPDRAAGVVHPQRPQSQRAASHGRARPDEAGRHQLARRPRRADRTGQQP